MFFDKKRVWAIVSCAVILGVLIVSYISGSTCWLENRRKVTKLQISASFSESEAEYNKLAASFLEASENMGVLYSFDGAHANLSETLEQQVEEFGRKVKVEFSSIYTAGQAPNLYPENACVFRSIVKRKDEIYCWVDLVYCKNWEEELAAESMQSLVQNEIISQVAPHWCIVTMYGY